MGKGRYVGSLIGAMLLLITTCSACADRPKAASPAAPQASTSAAPSYLTDEATIARGKQLFASKTCSACHNLDRKVVGPPLRGITTRRDAAWLKQMIAEPDRMTKEDPEGQKLLAEYKTPMPKLALAADELDALMAYLHANK